MEEKIFSILDILAEKLNTTVDHLWRILIDQALISSITMITGVAISLAIGFILVVLAFKQYDKTTWGSHVSDDRHHILTIVYGIVGGFMLFISLVVLVSNLTDLSTALFNPEYFAFQELKRMLIALK